MTNSQGQKDKHRLLDIGPCERLITECVCQTMNLTAIDQQDKLIFKFFADRGTDRISHYVFDSYFSGHIKKKTQLQ